MMTDDKSALCIVSVSINWFLLKECCGCSFRPQKTLVDGYVISGQNRLCSIFRMKRTSRRNGYGQAV